MDEINKETISTSMPSNQKVETDKIEQKQDAHRTHHNKIETQSQSIWPEEKVSAATNFNVKDSHDGEVDSPGPRNVSNEQSTTFTDLCPEIKQIIFEKLNLSSKYNLSLVCKDMAHEFWRSVDVDKRWESINNLEDLEHAGVLASAGYRIMTRRDWLSIMLDDVDVSGIPENIINNLVKIVNNRIWLSGVKGWRTSILNGVNCERLIISDMHLETGPEKKLLIRGFVRHVNVRGDCHGLFNRLRTDEIKTNLIRLADMEIKGLEDTEDSQNMNLEIRKLILVNVKGNLSSLFANIKLCDGLLLHEIEPSLLFNPNMTEILNHKVKRLEINSPFPEWMNQYDGRGMCNAIQFLPRYSKSYGSWAKERGWKMIKMSSIIALIYRPH